MAGELTIDEQVVAEGYRQVSLDSSKEAEILQLGDSVASVLLDRTVNTREEILLRILRVNGDPIDDSEEAMADLERRLSEVSTHLGSLAARAERMATGARKTAEHVEHYGLPE